MYLHVLDNNCVLGKFIHFFSPRSFLLGSTSLRHISMPPNMRLHRVPEDDWQHPPPLPPPPPPPDAIPAFYYDDYLSDEDIDDYSRKNVPIWLSLCLVVAYIVWGAFIFKVNCDELYNWNVGACMLYYSYYILQ